MDPRRTYGSMYLHAYFFPRYWQLREDWKQQASHREEHSWCKGRTRASRRGSWEEQERAAAAASQPWHPPKYLVNRGVPTPVHFHVSSQVVFPVKALTAYLARKTDRLTMNGFSRSLQTTLSRKTPVTKTANIHV